MGPESAAGERGDAAARPGPVTQAATGLDGVAWMAEKQAAGESGFRLGFA